MQSDGESEHKRLKTCLSDKTCQSYRYARAAGMCREWAFAPSASANNIVGYNPRRRDVARSARDTWAYTDNRLFQMQLDAPEPRVRKPDAYIKSSVSSLSIMTLVLVLMLSSLGRSIKPATCISLAVFAATTPFAMAARVPARPTWFLHFISLGLDGVQEVAWYPALFSPLAAQAQNYVRPVTLRNKGRVAEMLRQAFPSVKVPLD
ncbi:hypothetical protein C8Q78DRAFT_1146920 [Trametes maxima]|nr:hypothetical protein C8Q78DRAFT_1146920 [Trametes maxima]